MKKLTTLFFLLAFLFSSIHAQQTLLGVCMQGGDQFGTIIHYHPGDTIISDVTNFKGTIGLSGKSGLIEIGNKIYGVTYFGGGNYVGTIFEYNRVTQQFKSLHQFGDSNFYEPESKLLKAANGKIYGTTLVGSSIFEYDPVSNSYIDKYIYDVSFAGLFSGNIMQASNGKIYGITSGLQSSLHPNGMIYEYDINSNSLTPIYFFDGITGKTGIGTLIETSNGILYGMCRQGGSGNVGVIFEFNINSSTYTKKVDFTGLNGASPLFNSLTKGQNGKLYGTTDLGGIHNAGVLFEYDQFNNQYSKKYDFISASGENPVGQLVELSWGIFSGLTKMGGVNDRGVVYEFDTNTNNYTKKVDFDSQSGNMPTSSFLKSNNGKYYYVTEIGGIADQGTLVEYNHVSNSINTKVNFDNSNGNECLGKLTLASNGLFYGMTFFGGKYNNGVVFEYDFNLKKISKKTDLSDVLGKRPQGTLIQASNGKLYGLTREGGLFNNGTIIEYDPLTNQSSNRFDFYISSGTKPLGNLIQAMNGKLYGLTSEGGMNNVGTLFSFDIQSNTYSKLFDFSDSIGSNPKGTLIELNNSELYGLTSSGTFLDGTLFKYNYATNNLTLLKTFYPYGICCIEGSLVKGTNGNLYGIGPGGQNGSAIFMYDVINDSLIIKADFASIDGENPRGELFQASNSKFYGLTETGGVNHRGVIFEFDDNTGIFTKKIDLNSVTGNRPYASSFVAAECVAPGILPSGPTGICQGDSVLLNSTGAPGSTFQWKRNGNIIPGAINQSFMATQQGKYTVTVTDPVCSNTLTSNPVKVTIICLPPIDPGQKSMLLDDDEMTSNLVVSETSQNVYSINCTHLQGSGFTLSFYNTLGQLMLSRKGTIQNSEMHELIDCSALSSGLYVLKIVTEKERVSTKFLFQK